MFITSKHTASTQKKKFIIYPAFIVKGVAQRIRKPRRVLTKVTSAVSSVRRHRRILSGFWNFRKNERRVLVREITNARACISRKERGKKKLLSASVVDLWKRGFVYADFIRFLVSACKKFFSLGVRSKDKFCSFLIQKKKKKSLENLKRAWEKSRVKIYFYLRIKKISRVQKFSRATCTVIFKIK